MNYLKKNEQSIYVLTIGDFNISLSAFLVLVAGFILAVGTTILVPKSLQIAGILILISVVVAYEINCFEFGKCDSLAWGMSIVYVIYSMLVLYVIYKKRPGFVDLSEIMDYQKLINSLK